MADEKNEYQSRVSNGEVQGIISKVEYLEQKSDKAPVLGFTLSVKNFIKNGKDLETAWFRVKVFPYEMQDLENLTAELNTVGDGVTRLEGWSVKILGDLTFRTWTDNDGNLRPEFELILRRMSLGRYFLPKENNGGGQGGGGNSRGGGGGGQQRQQGGGQQSRSNNQPRQSSRGGNDYGSEAPF